MTYLANPYFNVNSAGLDAAGRVRSSNLYTLGDYKQLNAPDLQLLDMQGTATISHNVNQTTMSVTSGQYGLIQSKQIHHYFSGKSQLVEATSINFHQQANTTKRIGYFSSSTISPYTADQDGFWIEQDGANGLSIEVSRFGTNVTSIPFTSWDGYSKLSSYDWQNFTVFLFDFLWLGGAVLRLFVKTPDGWRHAHTYDYPGLATDVFIRYPNQPIRYEIRSSTGTGSLTYVCAQVSTEGATNHNGKTVGVDGGHAKTTCPSIGTSYVLLGVRKQASQLYRSAKLQDIFANVSSVNNQGILQLQVNPTMTGIGSWTTVSNTPVEYLPPGGTVTSPGHVLLSAPVGVDTSIGAGVLGENFLTKLTSDIDGNPDSIVMVMIPTTPNVPVTQSMNVIYDGE